MLNQDTQRDAAHLGILAAHAQAYERWHNAAVEVIHKRMLRRRLSDERQLEVGAIALQLPPASLFADFDDIDAALRTIAPPSHTDRMQIAEIRMWLRDTVTDLCEFHLDHAIESLERSVHRLDWLVHHKSRTGSRAYRILDEASADRLLAVLDRVDALLSEVTRVRALVAA